jgi:tetratricopeptide (TPR) repeat protein
MMNAQEQELQPHNHQEHILEEEQHEPSVPFERDATFHQLRPPVTTLVGRDALIEQLIAMLPQAEQTDAAGVVVLLHGMEGIGKTELAYAFAQRVTHLFPDAQLLLEMDGMEDTPLLPAHALQQIIHVFKPQAQVAGDIDTLQERYRSVLQDKRVLIIADDVGSIEQVTRLQPPPGSLLVLTARQSLALHGAHVEHIQPLEQSDAEHLLLTICPRIEQHATRLAHLCQGIPFMLHLHAGLLAEYDTLEVEQHLVHLEATLQRGEDLQTCSLQMSYDALGSLEQATLRQVSVFPSSFDMEAARAVVSLHGIKPTKGRYALVSDEEAETTEKPRGRAAPPAGEQIMSCLHRMNLVEFDPTIESYHLHPLVRRFATTLLGEQEQNVYRRHAKYYAGIATEIENLYLQGGNEMFEGLDIYDQEQAHIEQSWNWAREHEEDTLLLNFLCVIGHMGLMRYHIRDDYIPRAQQVLAAARRLKRRGDECHVLNVLGSAHRSLGDLQTAIEYYQEALSLLRTVRKQSNEVSVLGNLGNAFLNLGNVEQAVKHYKRSLKIARKHQDVRGECAALGQLGLAHAEMGATSNAMEHYEQSLALARQYHYRDYEEEILTGMGRVYCEMGESDHALSVGMRALSISQELGNRRDEGYTLNMLGQADIAIGDFAQAQEHQEAALAIANEIGDRRLEERTLTGLGEIALAQQEYDTALKHLEAALALAQTIGDRGGAATAGWNLGLALLQQGEHDQSNLTRAVELMQIRVSYEKEIGHPAVAEHAAHVAKIKSDEFQKGP